MGIEVTVERSAAGPRPAGGMRARLRADDQSDAVRAQVEGCILQTLSRTLFEEVTFDRSRVTSTDWASYPILTFPDVPQLDIELIDRRDEPPLGAGEAATAPVAAAVGNAVFDATGRATAHRAVHPARVKEALAARAT